MELSKALLNETDIGNKIFNNSIEKVRSLIKDIFGVDFKSKESFVKENIDEKMKIYNLSFEFKGRIILTVFSYEETDKEILKEVLKIHEYENSEIQLEKTNTDFNKSVNTVLDILEAKYELNFTPLDPSDIDKNIFNINNSIENETWKVTFKADFHESEYRATYVHNSNVIKIEEHKQHIIYLD